MVPQETLIHTDLLETLDSVETLIPPSVGTKVMVTTQPTILDPLALVAVRTSRADTSSHLSECLADNDSYGNRNTESDGYGDNVTSTGRGGAGNIGAGVGGYGGSNDLSSSGGNYDSTTSSEGFNKTSDTYNSSSGGYGDSTDSSDNYGSGNKASTGDRIQGALKEKVGGLFNKDTREEGRLQQGKPPSDDVSLRHQLLRPHLTCVVVL